MSKKKRRSNQNVAWVRDKTIPQTSRPHNYEPVAAKAIAEWDGDLDLGGLHHLMVYHEDWCGIYKKKRCNCSPEVEILTNEQYIRKQATIN